MIYPSDSEFWKPIPGFEGLYEASTHGRIRTAEGKTTSSARYPIRVWKQRILKPKLTHRRNSDKQDQRVELWKDGEHKTYLVARLIALTWLPCDDYSLTVNHIDGNSLNNHISNLEFVTLEQNIKHGYDTGLYGKCQKQCVLTFQDGTSKSFDSLSEASRAIGRLPAYISNQIGKGMPCYDNNRTLVTVYVGGDARLS